MRAALIILLVSILGIADAQAQQGAVKQSGQVTPRHGAMWTTQGVIMDAGKALGGPLGTNLSELGIQNTGTPFCITDNPTTQPYHQLCFGALSLGGGLISYNAYGGALPEPVNCVINGTFVADCLASGSGGLAPGGPPLSLQYNNGGVFGGYVVGGAFTVTGGTFNLGTFTGDVSAPAGTLATTVVGLQGRPMASTAPTTGQLIGWNGSQWVPVTSVSGINQLLGPVTAGPGTGPQTTTITPTGVVAGSYTLASSGGAFFCQTIESSGQILSMTAGACGGGGCGGAGLTGGGGMLTGGGGALTGGGTPCGSGAVLTGGGGSLTGGGGSLTGG